MTGDLLSVRSRVEAGNLLAAGGKDLRAPGMKNAPLRALHRARHISLEAGARSVGIGVGQGNGGKQRLRIRVTGVFDEGFRGTRLD